jgi:ParB family transcriptional regulator, chromosome partitioning protein
MTTTTHIPLKQLAIWDGNVRKTEGSDTALAELAASIASVGVINPLTVFTKGKKHLVVAGGRRLAALNQLLKSKVIDEDYAVPCTVTTEEHATEISIAENVVRENMHPADEFEAFLRLSKDGVSNEDISAKFGVTPTVVTKRLKLANVSPKIIASYREGDIDLECVMAYAVTDDVKRQERVFKSLSGYRGSDADSIRGALTEDEITARDKRVRFVTLKAYEKAGGKTRRDLFADEKDQDGIYVLDVDLLEDLVTKKLEKAAASVRKEGWNWVEIRDEFSWDAKGKFKQLREGPVPLPADLQAEIDSLTAEYNAIYDTDGEMTDEQSERVDEIDARIDEIEGGQETAWPEGTFEVAGAVVTLGYDGNADITRGLVRPGDVKKLPTPKQTKAVTDDGDDPDLQAQPSPGAGLSAKLVEQLTEHRTAALAAELIDKPSIGLAAVAFCLALDIFTHGRSSIHVDLRKHSHEKVEGSPAYKRIEQARQQWGDTVPGTPGMLWAWCLVQDRSVLIDLITFCAAMSIDAVIKKRGSMDFGTDVKQADDVAIAVGLDMKNWFTPTAENYFNHVSKPQIIQALTEAGKKIAPAWNKAKKSELAKIAEAEIAGTGWLPELLRTAEDDSAQALQEAA